jgi:NADPH-dependent 7-cyano-7-deazaguanine reductase QueF-like protein
MNHTLVKYDSYTKYESKTFSVYQSYLTSMNQAIIFKFKKIRLILWI